MLNNPEFQALRREYLESAAERCAHLMHEVERLRAGQPVDLAKLRQEVHKFRGSGGFYGFQELSAASGRAEDHMIMVIDGKQERDGPAIAALVKAVVAACRSAQALLENQ